MAYRDFKLDDIQEKFGINNRQVSLFGIIKPLELNSQFLQILEDIKELKLRSEKSKSEAIVFPILNELRRLNNRFFMIFSGENLDVEPKKGLKGECDFILAKDTGTFNINNPIIQVVEAKKNDLEFGIPQCAAQMIGAKFFNQKKGTPLDIIYGCVTTGNEWQFIKLGTNLEIDLRIYYLNELPEILGVFQYIIDYYKSILK